MSENLQEMFGKYKQKGIFIDTNILVLYIVGTINPKYIKRFNRGKNDFDENDFILISEFIDSFETKITSPQILSEVSNFLDEKADFCLGLKAYIELSEEKYIESEDLTKSHTFLKFGLADSSIVEVSKGSYLIFTDERPLFGYLTNQGIDAVNFEWLKSESLF